MDEVVDELAVLLDQLDEVMGEPIIDADDAFEVAVLAGLAARLGGGPAVDKAAAWRDDNGRDLLDEAWEELDGAELLASIDEVIGGDATAEEVEEAVLVLDEDVAAAGWDNKGSVVRPLAIEAERTIRAVPETFAFLAEDGREMAMMRDVAEHPDLYGFWLAIADAAAWADN